MLERVSASSRLANIVYLAMKFDVGKISLYVIRSTTLDTS